jgi:hypothetical protein
MNWNKREEGKKGRIAGGIDSRLPDPAFFEIDPGQHSHTLSFLRDDGF